MQTVWQKLPKPFFVLAPMENVTDTVFRQIIIRCGRPDIFFTEFTNVDGMVSKGRDRVIHRLQFSEIERPIIAQIWGNNPDHYYEAVKLIKQMGFDGVDINMGCPANKVVAKGFCAGLIRNPDLAREIIVATKEAAGDLPVSVKTRIGYEKIQTEEWASFLLQFNLAALTIHGRTAAEMSKVPAHWEEIGKVVALRDKLKVNSVIIGNGDIKSREDGLTKFAAHHVDGLMVGRGIFDNLWLFNKDQSSELISHKDKLQLMIEHIKLFTKTWGKGKNYEILKKFYKVYVSGVPDAAQLRAELMSYKTTDETIDFLLKRIDSLGNKSSA